jgi:hypothetical protein
MNVLVQPLCNLRKGFLTFLCASLEKPLTPSQKNVFKYVK